jgi:hypothetical protein
MVNSAGVFLEPNATTTIRNNRGMLERVDESFPWCLHYCIDNNGGHVEHFGND